MTFFAKIHFLAPGTPFLAKFGLWVPILTLKLAKLTKHNLFREKSQMETRPKIKNYLVTFRHFWLKSIFWPLQANFGPDFGSTAPIQGLFWTITFEPIELQS